MTTSRTNSASIRTLPRWMWRAVIVYISLVLVTYFFALPVRLSQLIGNPNLTPALALSQLVADYLLIFITSGTGLILVRRRHNEYIAVLMSMALVVVLPNIPGMSYLPVQLHPLFHIPAAIATITTAPIAFLLLISLPDGYAYPRKLLWIIPIMLIADSIRYVLLFVFPPPNVLNIRAFAVIPNFILIGVALVAMRYRYRHHATPIQRQQFKWLFLGLTIEVIIVILNQAFRVLVILLEGNIAISQLIISFTGALGGIIVCISLVLAISRYGLWDVDLTINRSMVAGFVTIVLMIIFGVIFWIAQTILTALLGKSRGEIAIAVSGLVIGISFNPVRKRVRTFVDRRLYGFRFDLNQLSRHKDRFNVIYGAFTGQIIGGYQILEVIGRGSMGEVYKGVTNHQYVAIKIMKTSHNLHGDIRQRFERESKILLEHPNIIKTLGGGEENGVVYIVMEYVEGRTLKELLNEKEYFNLADIQHHLHSLAKAVDYAHSKGYIHRDIKPSNIMFRRGGTNQTSQIMLMDFGIAKFLGDTGSLTGSDAVGTIDYMAPEQIMDSTTVDFRADIYALGVVLYETLTGVLPFKGTLAQILFAHVNQPAPDIRQLRPDLSFSVSIAIQRALQKDPADRFQSAEEFVKLLTSAL